jgi:hypothetical protein
MKYEDLYWIHLAHNRVQYQSLVVTVKNLAVP